MQRSLLLIILFLAGCATQPLYSPARNSESVGYFETRLTEDRYRVTFNGGLNTPGETVKNYALLRAAELTIANGYNWFEIVDRDDNRNVGERDGPRVSVGVGVGTGRVGHCYPFGCRVFGGPYYSGVGLYTTDYRDRRQSVIEILMGKGEPEDPTKVYDADELLKNLRKDVGH